MKPLTANPLATIRKMPTGRPFQKGVSGNPGGRSRVGAAIARMIREQTDDGVELVTMVLAIARGKHKEFKTESSRLWAIRWLADRAFGYAPMVVELAPVTHEYDVDDALDVMADAERKSER